ncbi:TPA: hypothetical protein ACH3X3_012609 [Trebouxia sp. C0006]
MVPALNCNWSNFRRGKALQTASQDKNRWKAQAEEYAAIATEHAADAEDILGQSYGLLSKVKGVAVLLPHNEAKALLNTVLEQHESTVLAWHEQDVPLAKQHVPTMELADVSNCLAGVSLANICEVVLLPPGLLDRQQPGEDIS